MLVSAVLGGAGKCYLASRTPTVTAAMSAVTAMPTAAAMSAAAMSAVAKTASSTDLASYFPNISEPGMDLCLAAHNTARAILKQPALVWDPQLAAQAQGYSGYLAATNLFQHSGAPSQGENLYRGQSSCGAAVLAWFRERTVYRGDAIGTVWLTLGAGNFEGYGHYTQIVWPTTTRVGCGLVGTTVVCRYTPPGNIAGQKLSSY